MSSSMCDQSFRLRRRGDRKPECLHTEGAHMHALLMSYVSNLPFVQLHTHLERYAQALTATDGLVMKTWLLDDSVVGGFYLFDNRHSAEAFMRGPVWDE